MGGRSQDGGAVSGEGAGCGLVQVFGFPVHADWYLPGENGWVAGGSCWSATPDASLGAAVAAAGRPRLGGVEPLLAAR